MVAAMQILYSISPFIHKAEVDTYEPPFYLALYLPLSQGSSIELSKKRFSRTNKNFKL